MFSNKHKASNQTYLSPNTSIIGNLEADSNLLVEGSFVGNIRAIEVNVAKNAKIIGNITAETVEIYGKVEGHVTARFVKCGPISSIAGDVIYDELKVVDGAVIKGKCNKVSTIAENKLVKGVNKDIKDAKNSKKAYRGRRKEPITQ